MKKPKINVVATNPRNPNVLSGYTIASDHVFFILSGPRKNVINNFTGFDRMVLSERERDLLDLSVSVHMADLSVKKNPFTGARRIDLLVPVADPDYWNSHAPTISAICTFLDRNPFHVHFVEQRDEVHRESESPELEPDVVCCFSGGLDSLAGAHELLGTGRSVLLSTVIHGRVVAGIANAAYKAIQRHHGEVNRSVFNACAIKGGRSHQYAGRLESSMHCRSFIYLTSAAVVAHHFGAKEVVIPENGVFALNIPLNRGRLGTRTVHPIFVKQMEQLLNKILSGSLSIVNPFERLTKAEVVSRLSDIPESISNTVSCAKAWRTPTIAYRLSKLSSRHCGSCHPCIVRRISTIISGFEVHDSSYVIDMFNDLFPRASSRKEYRDAAVAVLEVLKFSHDIIRLDIEGVRHRYSEFEELPDNYEVDEAILMYKRYANEVQAIFADKSSDSMKRQIGDYLV